MRKLVVIETLSLDGVMQAPGSPDEDTEGGFKHGGWGLPFHDEIFGAAAAAGMAATDAHLFGRKTYEKMAAYWSTGPSDSPFTDHLNNTPKYVASTTLQEAAWQNSALIHGDVGEEVAKLKDQPGKNIAVLGSADLVQTLIANDLVDEYFLLICPIVLGSGKRLFRDADQTRNLRLVDSQTTGTGSLMVTYQPIR